MSHNVVEQLEALKGKLVAICGAETTCKMAAKKSVVKGTTDIETTGCNGSTLTESDDQIPINIVPFQSACQIISAKENRLAPCAPKPTGRFWGYTGTWGNTSEGLTDTMGSVLTEGSYFICSEGDTKVSITNANQSTIYTGADPELIDDLIELYLELEASMDGFVDPKKAAEFIGLIHELVGGNLVDPDLLADMEVADLNPEALESLINDPSTYDAKLLENITGILDLNFIQRLASQTDHVMSTSDDVSFFGYTYMMLSMSVLTGNAFHQEMLAQGAGAADLNTGYSTATLLKPPASVGGFGLMILSGAISAGAIIHEVSQGDFNSGQDGAELISLLSGVTATVAAGTPLGWGAVAIGILSGVLSIILPDHNISMFDSAPEVLAAIEASAFPLIQTVPNMEDPNVCIFTHESAPACGD